MSDFRIHCLDVGAFNYGDSILCVFDGATILIDGGTPRSGASSDSVVLGDDIRHEPIQDQMRRILGQGGTVEVDLLIVTHCHSDHMGCLPELVRSGQLRCRWALLADPQLGYGITADSDEPPPTQMMSDSDKLWLALREEPLFGATDWEIARFIEDSAAEYEAYVTFVNQLRNQLDSRCVVYRGPSDEESEGLSDLLEEFEETGLHIYGPSSEQLISCAGRLIGRSEDLVADALADSPKTLVEAYKSALDVLSAQDAEDSGDGAAVNCQSLVLRLGANGTRVLLTGDMQFARPDVGEAGPMVKELLKTVSDDGPFAWVKLSHHGATNGQNPSILAKWGAKLLTLSTGSKSTKHPTEPTLKALEQAEPSGVQWSRVDMNGVCTFSSIGNVSRLSVERGERNDKTRPSARSGDTVPERRAAEIVTTATALQSPVGAFSLDDDLIEIRIKLPRRRTKISFTCEVEEGGQPRPFEAGAVSELAADTIASKLRSLPRLCFVTDGAALARNIGPRAADILRQAIREANHRLVDQPQGSLLEATRATLGADQSLKGVVILGGYDVVRSQIVNSLPAELAQFRIRDRDKLQVWSDDAYGDRDGDAVPELPVSRVPDGGSADFLWRVLSSASVSGKPRERSGIRNLNRPFADDVFRLLPGARPLFTSEATPPNLPPFTLTGDFLYLMLHGTASDTSTFSGEDLTGGYPVAIDVSGLPGLCPPVVFTGCCYGALIADTLARDAAPGDPIRTRNVEESIALSCLARGTNAFVGCTGVHFSPTQRPFNYFGEPMHRRFTEHLLAGEAPALALWGAKVDYAAGIPHRADARVEEIAYEHKILRQFTCLGLGW